MAKKDPFMLDPNDVKDVKSGLKNSSAGVICPKLNKQISTRCAVCDSLQPLWQYPKGHAKREIAVQKKAKVNFYMNVVFPEDPNKSYILEVGKQAGNAIIAGIEKKGWTDIIHPKANMGRELQITKGSADGYNQYSVTPVLNKADWDIPKKVLDNLPNLDNTLEMVKNNELNDDNFKRVSDIKMDETLTFRMCPPAQDAVMFRFIAYVWRHWGGVTQAEVDGEEAVNLNMPDIDENSDSDTPQEELWENNKEATEEPPLQPPAEDMNQREPCFGKNEFFDATDDDCQECKDFKACKKACKASL
jgi:hypothetical protein